MKNLLSRNVRQSRTAAGLSLEELAEKAGISVPYLCAIERGEKWPSPATLSEIAQSFDLEPHDLIRPEHVSLQEVRRVVAKLSMDISDLMNQSAKILNAIAKENNKAAKKKAD